MKQKFYTTLAVLLLIGITAFSQGKATQLTGKVKDSNTGEALAGVWVKIDGTKSVTQTDAQGHFSIKLTSNPPYTVILTNVGYEKQESIVDNADEEYTFEIRQSQNRLNQVVVTARRQNETAQDVPIPISVVSGRSVAETGSFNVNRLKELVPTVQLYSSNPRNTGLSIRGLGTTFGLTNDGIDPGVGFYVDGVYFARTAATTLDFIDVDQVEVLRGPQGTLFGKNTTAGAFNVTTRKPSFTPSSTFELNYGNYNYVQAKSSITGPLVGKVLAGRISFSGTQRDGTVYNVATQTKINTLNNLGVRGQLLFTPNEKNNIILAADATRQRPLGYAQVYAGTVTTQRSAYRQFNQIIKDLGYSLPSTNPFDRVTDTDTPWRSNQDLGGISLNADFKLGSGTLTSTSAWRYWNWDPSNDRDFIGLQALALSQAPSKHNQWSQELRWTGSFSEKLNAVFGLYAFGQNLKTDPVHTEEVGKDQWRFLQAKATGVDALWATPGLLNGFGIKTKSELNTLSGAIFTQVTWKINKHFSVLPGLRFNYDKKQVDYQRTTYGGLAVTAGTQLDSLKKTVYTNQQFAVNKDNFNFSGQFTIAYKAGKNFNAFATYSTGYKPVGLNLGGLPTANGAVLTDLAVIQPERVYYYEVGIKSSPTKNSTLNITVYNNDIRDYQTQVQAADLSVNRGYVANAEKVRVTGAELEGSISPFDFVSLKGSVAYTDAKYVKFTNAPLPLEEAGLKVNGKSVYGKDISGGELPGVSKWAGSFTADFTRKGKFNGQKGDYSLAFDTYSRSKFSSNPTPSAFLNVDGYTLVNARVGFRTARGLSTYLWGRNIFGQNYFEQLLPGAGNSGQYAAVLGDPRTYGVTLRYTF